ALHSFPTRRSSDLIHRRASEIGARDAGQRAHRSSIMGGSALIDSMNDGAILPEAEVLPGPTMRRGPTGLAVPQIRHPEALVGTLQRVARAIQIGDFVRREEHRL